MTTIIILLYIQYETTIHHVMIYKHQQDKPAANTPTHTLKGRCSGGCEGGSGGDERHSGGELILRNSPPPEIQVIVYC